MASRSSRLMARMALSRQSMVKLKGDDLISRTSRGSLWRADRPNFQASRGRLAGHEVMAQGLPQRNLLGGDGDEGLGLGDYQRLEAVAVLDVRQRIAAGCQVAERAIKVVQRGA